MANNRGCNDPRVYKFNKDSAVSKKKQWLDSASFLDLPPEGRDALLKFTKSRNDKNRLEFWFLTPDEASTPFMKKYLEEGEDKLPDVQHNDDVATIINHASEIDSFISRMKERMRPDLNNVFRAFKKSLEEEIQREKRS